MSATPQSNPSEVSLKRLAANRRNARKSTGPRTPEGKARSSQNAITHGMFCVDILVEGESRRDYHCYRHEMIRRLDPSDALELQFADQIIQTGWKLKRIQGTEQVIFAARRKELQRERPEQSFCPGYVLGDLLWNSQDFGRIQIYEQRLLNVMNRATNQLRQLKKDKKDGILSEFAGKLIVEEREILEDIENEANDAQTDTTDEPAETCEAPPSPSHIDRPTPPPVSACNPPPIPPRPPDSGPPRR